MTNNHNIVPSMQIPAEIRRDFGAPDDPEAIVLAEMYRNGVSSATDEEWLRYVDALSRHPEHKAYLDEKRNVSLGRAVLDTVGDGIEQESGQEIKFRASTFEEAKNLPNQFNEKTAKLFFETWSRVGDVTLSYGVYEDNEYERPYSDSADLRLEYYEQMKEVRKDFSDKGFQAEDNSLVFVQYTSPALLDTLQRVGSYSKPTKRIYLNPHPQDTAQVFSRILDTVADNNLSLQAKVAEDPLVEGSMVKHRDDRIVIYVDDSQADTMLSLVSDIYREYSESFEESRIPVVTTEIAPGFGVTDEKSMRDKNGDKLSASAYRERLLGQLMHRMPEIAREKIRNGSYDPERLSQFAKVANQLFTKVGVSTHNWSFYE